MSSKSAVIPQGFQESATLARMSPAISCAGFLFLTDVTGAGPDGVMPVEAEAQFRAAFAKITATLAAAGAGPDAVVEMTSWHIGLREHFDLFDRIRTETFSPPYPAWTAVEAAGLRREGAIVEIRAIAHSG